MNEVNRIAKLICMKRIWKEVWERLQGSLTVNEIGTFRSQRNVSVFLALISPASTLSKRK